MLTGAFFSDYGPEEDSSDLDLSEDAHFVAKVRLPDEIGQERRDVIYAGVADGVGSWREYGVDPRDFSRALMQECKNILLEAGTKGCKRVDKGDEKFRRQIAPCEVMAQAYERVKADNIIGSSTACVGMFDGLRHLIQMEHGTITICAVLKLIIN